MILIFEGARIWYSPDLPIHAAPVCLAAEDIGPVLVRKGDRERGGGSSKILGHFDLFTNVNATAFKN